MVEQQRTFASQSANLASIIEIVQQFSQEKFVNCSQDHQHDPDEVYASFIAFKENGTGLTPSGLAWFNNNVPHFLKSLNGADITTVSSTTMINFLGKYNDRPYRKKGFYVALGSFYKWVSQTYQVSLIHSWISLATR